jgi:hypothetical protein
MPLLIVEANGSVRSPLTLVGDLVAGPPLPRRRRSFLRDRRSRFLRRRRPGCGDTVVHTGGREIIARN